ncbi:M1 family metallopeptidase [Piscinibacter sp. XHJ-5]|uniref:M1 family metallopeptidase n=1 Tax=Piscinibacter sp. XHJ-5 TaxID=3037797 RepID=UPI0024536C66|nr:M1 family metallopeptidase [Piscinibacter sp. XHJ-5]
MRRRLAVALVAAFALAAAAAASAQARFQFDTTPGRLSKQVVPSHYTLTLHLDPARDRFEGRVAIALRVREPMAAIELHAHELAAGRARLVSAAAPRELAITPQPAAQMWRLAPQDGQVITAGEYRLEIDYSGKVRAYGDGLYRAPHGPQGRQLMLATQLEAIYARTVFPAFDEPAFRAAFDIRVRAPGGFEVVSNMPRASRRLEGGSAVHRFKTTPPMPTYLVSVAVGRFDVLTGRAAGVPLRLLTAPGRRPQARYAMQASKELLPYYSAYFGVPFALPKLDQLAVPSTRWGAMEDWGLISYAEDMLLFDPKSSSPDTQRDVYATVAHEIAHQWFGNLVTAASWEEIWLNEAFATWMQDKAMDRFNPAWEVPLQRRVPVDQAMAQDAGAATRPIRSGPVSETAVWDVFDGITYAKGGAVLGMLEQWIGPDVFQRGLASYMKERRLSNATAGDLWHHMAQASGRDVLAVTSSWTDQSGFPRVQVSTACEAGRTRVTLAQSRFSTSSAPLPAQRWHIPVRLLQGRHSSTVLLSQPQAAVELGGCDDGPVLANAGGIGFYRVAYEPAQLDTLTARFAALAPVDRVTLLSDTFALLQAGEVAMPPYLRLLSALPQVQGAGRTALWQVAGAQLELLDRVFAGTAAQPALHAYARSLLAPQLARLGWEPRADDDAQTLQLRAGLITLLARFDDPAVVTEAVRRFDRDEAGRGALPASIRAAVIGAVGRHADRVHFDRLLARLGRTEAEEDRQLFARSLAAGRDAARADELLAACLKGSAAPGNVASAVPGYMALESPFGELAYRWSVAHWARWAALAGTTSRTALLPRAAAGFNDEAQAARLVEDQRRAMGPDGDVQAAREAEDIRLRAAVKARYATGFRPE